MANTVNFGAQPQNKGSEQALSKTAAQKSGKGSQLGSYNPKVVNNWLGGTIGGSNSSSAMPNGSQKQGNGERNSATLQKLGRKYSNKRALNHSTQLVPGQTVTQNMYLAQQQTGIQGNSQMIPAAANQASSSIHSATKNNQIIANSAALGSRKQSSHIRILAQQAGRQAAVNRKRQNHSQMATHSHTHNAGMRMDAADTNGDLVYAKARGGKNDSLNSPPGRDLKYNSVHK